jgi:hypothetical protein
MANAFYDFNTRQQAYREETLQHYELNIYLPAWFTRGYSFANKLGLN